MELCHVEEHLSCFQYGKHDAAMEIVKLKKGEDFQIFSDSNEILFVMQGEFEISSKKIKNKKINTGESILVPQNTPSIITAMEDVTILEIKLKISITFCDRLPLELLLESQGKITKDAPTEVLPPNKRLMEFANMIQEYISDGLKCTFFFDIKIREFLFLIRSYYDKQVILNFFKPIYSTDFVFSNNIYKNLDKIRTVKEMAETLEYSLSGFEKKFRKVFNISPYQWMQEQKARKIYHEIHCTKKTFTEMAFEYDFSSPAHFNVFCRIHFGKTPGDLRKENLERAASSFS